MTETCVGVTLTPAGSPNGYSHTCGPVFPNAECLIVDTETLRSIAPGEGQGELWVRAASITMGYIDNAKETNEMFNIGGQGWMRSGDEAEFERGMVKVDGKITETWLLCIRDRLKELIKVYPLLKLVNGRFQGIRLPLRNWRMFLLHIRVLQINVLLENQMIDVVKFPGHLLSRRRRLQRRMLWNGLVHGRVSINNLGEWSLWNKLSRIRAGKF
jgi:hypothetical protein